MNTDRLKHAFLAALGVPANTDFEGLDFKNTDKWDSLAHMQLILEIEREFNVSLSDDDVLDVVSYRRAKEILGKHGLEFANTEGTTSADQTKGKGLPEATR